MLINKLACRLPSKNTFDELVYPPKALQHKGESFKLAVWGLLDMGNAMPPTTVNVHTNEGQFLARLLAFCFKAAS